MPEESYTPRTSDAQVPGGVAKSTRNARANATWRRSAQRAPDPHAARVRSAFSGMYTGMATPIQSAPPIRPPV